MKLTLECLHSDLSHLLERFFCKFWHQIFSTDLPVYIKFFTHDALFAVPKITSSVLYFTDKYVLRLRFREL